METTLDLLMNGFATAAQPMNLLFAFIGCVLGTLVGVLPGVGPVAAMAILIPITFNLEATPAIIMLSAIYYGAMYGGTITSVLVNVPGEAASAVTCLDGYQMAKNGRAGPALSVAAIGSFIGGTFATMGLVLMALPLTKFALSFGPAEFFSLMVLGLSLVTGLAGRSMARALASAAVGMLIAMVGIDPVLGAPRFTMDQVELMGGFGIVPVVMGLFGVGEILLNAQDMSPRVFTNKVAGLMPTRKDLADSAWPVTRGTLIGFFMGLIPGVGAIVTTFVSYVVEKNLSRYPDKFGTGVIEGVAAPEAANNSHHNAALIPMFTLGIPAHASMAVLMGAFMMNGLTPGPLLFRDYPQIAWAVIASLYIGNVILLILNLPLIPLWVQVLRTPYPVLFALILTFCTIGAYSLEGSMFDVGAMLAFGVLGFVMKKMDFPLAPLVLTLILGPLMEKSLRLALSFSAGDFSTFVTSPVSATLLAISVMVVVASVLGLVSKTKSSES